MPTLLAAGGGFNPLAFDPAALILTIIVVVVLFSLLAKFAWGPILAGIEARETKIEGDIEAAAKQRAEADALLTEYKNTVKNVEAEMAALREQGRTEAEAMRADILAKADADAKERSERAVREIELAHHQALEDIRREAVHIGMAVAGKVVGRSVDGEDQQRLAAEVVSGLTDVQGA
ncbi:MAG: ATP synthase subunit b [Planctomycetota bacterium]|nr:MAG: ATP synthase subunit b [Planctomycetota bacterium]